MGALPSAAEQAAEPHQWYAAAIPTPVGNLTAFRSPTAFLSPTGLDDYFGRKQKGRAAVVELHQIHVAAKIIDLAHDQGFFVEAAATLAVANRSDDSTMPTDN
ncbi:MAG: hypothetical protein IVW56_03610 [Candidatus Binataceae bacterium]|nr:hypothetical protein [Candidatus Binataceae bacterium]